jgi:hypothetical protein
MSNRSYSIANIFPIRARARNRFASIASQLLAETQEGMTAVCDTLEQNFKFAARAWSKANRKASRISRRYPIPIIAASLALGFLIGRSSR